MAHHPANVVLIDHTVQIPESELQQYADAFTEDVNTNFGPVWAARARVSVVSSEAKKPRRAWAIHIQENLSEPGALGYHSDNLNQPVAYCKLTNDLTVTISHELDEMLADPYGNRMRHIPEPPPQGVDPAQLGLNPGDLVTYLVEVCDPPENSSHVVNGVSCSDFILPSWYDGSESRYSFDGYCTAPQQVAEGGYVSFAREDDEWFQVFNQGGNLHVSDLGKYDKTQAQSLREWVDEKAREFRNES